MPRTVTRSTTPADRFTPGMSTLLAGPFDATASDPVVLLRAFRDTAIDEVVASVSAAAGAASTAFLTISPSADPTDAAAQETGHTITLNSAGLVGTWTAINTATPTEAPVIPAGSSLVLNFLGTLTSLANLRIAFRFRDAQLA